MRGVDLDELFNAVGVDNDDLRKGQTLEIGLTKIRIKDFQVVGHQYGEDGGGYIDPLHEAVFYLEIIRPNDFYFGRLEAIFFVGHLITTPIKLGWFDMDVEEYEKEVSEFGKTVVNT